MIDYLNEAEKIKEEIINLRRHIHKNPELSFQEFKTSAFIKEQLSKLNIEHKTLAGTGVVALIGNGKNCLALRADIDALPIKEETGLPFCSENDGVMHACGHDMHTSMLLGTAKILKVNESLLNGTVKLIFQPGEEKYPGGASILIKEGVLENPRPKAVFGQHIFPEAIVGTVSVAPGYIMAAPDELYWTIKGKGGHAAQPHQNSDVILAASQMIVFLQSLMTKFKDPMNPGVLSVTSIHGGSATNIFPDEITLMGTFRSFNDEWRWKMHKEIEKTSKNVCRMYNAECELEIKKGYPAVYNNEDTTKFLKQNAIDLLGTKSVLNFEPKMWGEDFGFYAEKIPATFWFLGVRPEGQDEMPALHNSKISPNEDALVFGTAMMVKTAFEFLK